VPADVQIAVAARVVPAVGVVVIDPLVAAVMAPQLRVAVVERGGDDVVVADLMPGVGAAAQLGPAGLRRALL